MIFGGGRYTFFSKGLCNIFNVVTLKSNQSLLGINEVVNLSYFKHNYSTTNSKTELEGNDEKLTNNIRKSGLAENQRETAKDILKKYSHQVKSLSHIIECTEETACDMLSKYTFLITAEIPLLHAKIVALTEAGVAKDQWMNDMWIFTYSLAKLKERIQLVKDLNCNPIKPWQLRCSHEVLHRIFQNKENDRLALSPYQSVTDYIHQRLELTEVQVLTFARRHPPVMRVKVAKLKEVIDFLFSEGFTANQIYNTPRILCHSLKTIQKRVATLNVYNCKPYSLILLCKSQNKFDDYVRNLGNHKTDDIFE